MSCGNAGLRPANGFNAFFARPRLDFYQGPVKWRTTQMDAAYLGIVIVFFALCFGMVSLFERI